MSEVKSCRVLLVIDDNPLNSIWTQVYRSADFDRVTAERDALAQSLKFAEEGSQSFAEECDALQQRLTAPDERADVLEGLLRDVSESVTGRQGTFARIPADWFDRRDAALKPAEAAKCMACDGKRSVCIDWESGAWTECTDCAKSAEGKDE
ncbi:hypothetical protein [Pseudomonas costantinii]|uniref:Uncharacterized protein n=1 Tax=Pseudomonas costantinii TaxID=168469 RepID=A0A1S2V2E6_9PSED|nr:hypothetical protein [Pseudomonas costantinii]OIN52921.1 hypothetical protein BFL40_12535 [Pseudomonas costantinii]SED27769.1 hypothetical protein SAMN04515675_0534 [Pseudomonas costantinii]